MIEHRNDNSLTESEGRVRERRDPSPDVERGTESRQKGEMDVQTFSLSLSHFLAHFAFPSTLLLSLSPFFLRQGVCVSALVCMSSGMRVKGHV